jgi:hypothetical protein
MFVLDFTILIPTYVLHYKYFVACVHYFSWYVYVCLSSSVAMKW